MPTPNLKTKPPPAVIAWRACLGLLGVAVAWSVVVASAAGTVSLFRWLLAVLP